MNKATQLQITKTPKWQYILLIVLFVLIGLSIWAIFNIQKIRDWYILANYKPPLSISQIASYDTMTPYAKRLFYVNKPQLDNKTTFSSVCPNGTEQTYVLGCYHTGDNGIFLLDVHVAALNGLDQVTAAYEMLHAGYARLSNSSRTTIDQRMWNFYVHQVTNQEIKRQMAAYEATEPGAKYDELYSVLATEVTNLPTAINNQYKIYFYNRAKIVATYNKYQAAFISRENQIKQDDITLASLKKTIALNESKLNLEQKNLNNYLSTINPNGSKINPSLYNQEINQYNSLINSYNSLITQTRSEINNYNSIVDSRNSLALEEQQLISAISSKPSKAALKK